MEAADVPSALQERLGHAATAGLLELFDTARQEWTADVTIAAVERFERRFTEESANWRVALAQTHAALHQEIRTSEATLRQEIQKSESALRLEMQKSEGALRLEMQKSEAALRLEIREGDASIRQEMLAGRFELLKWCFVFWVGQVFAVAGVVAVLLRVMQT